MSVPLRIVDKPFPEVEEPGMMWRYPPGDVGIEGHLVDGRPYRQCWWIVLPNTKPIEPGLPSRISWRTTDTASAPPHEMWNVSGTPPNLTVTPSIDVECWRVDENGQSCRDGSHWHGFITNGELTP